MPIFTNNNIHQHIVIHESNKLLSRQVRDCLLSRTYNDFEVPRYFKSRVALTPEEICHVAHFDISKLERRPQYRQTLEKVRDTFVLLCNLGQRYSDIVRISPENSERNIFRIIQKKTGNKTAEEVQLPQPVHEYRIELQQVSS